MKRTNFLLILFLLFSGSCTQKKDHWLLAKKEVASDDFLGAIIELNQFIDEKGNSDSSLILRAYCYNRIEKHEKAEKDLREALKINPGNPKANLVYGQLLAYRGDTVSALKRLNCGNNRGSFCSEIMLERGRLLFYQGKYRETEQSLIESIEADSGNAKAWFYLGNFYSSFIAGRDSNGMTYYPLLDFNKALLHYNKSISLYRANPECYYRRAMVYINTRNISNGIADLSSAIKLEPESKAYYLLRAEQYEKQKQFDLANKDYRMVIKLNPSDSVAIGKIGKLFSK